MSKPLSSNQLADIEKCIGIWTPEQCARLKGYDLSEVRRIYAEGKR